MSTATIESRRPNRLGAPDHPLNPLSADEIRAVRRIVDDERSARRERPVRLRRARRAAQEDACWPSRRVTRSTGAPGSCCWTGRPVRAPTWWCRSPTSAIVGRQPSTGRPTATCRSSTRSSRTSRRSCWSAPSGWTRCASASSTRPRCAPFRCRPASSATRTRSGRRVVRVLALLPVRRGRPAVGAPHRRGRRLRRPHGQRRSMKVIDEIELPLPTERGEWNAEPHAVAARAPISSPSRSPSPKGPSFTVDGNQITWADWTFRFGFDVREGLTLHQLSLRDGDRSARSSTARRSPRWWCPYADPSPVAVLAELLRPGRVPVRPLHQLAWSWAATASARSSTSTSPSPTSTASRKVMKNAICLHEEDYGVLWKHTDMFNGMAETRRSAASRHLLLLDHRQLRLRVLLVPLPRRHHPARGQGHRHRVHVGLPRPRRLRHRDGAGPRRAVPPAPVLGAAGHGRRRRRQRRRGGRRRRRCRWARTTRGATRSARRGPR